MKEGRRKTEEKR